MNDKDLPMEISNDVVNSEKPRKIRRYVSKGGITVEKKSEKRIYEDFYGYRPGAGKTLLKRSDFDV